LSSSTQAKRANCRRPIITFPTSTQANPRVGPSWGQVCQSIRRNTRANGISRFWNIGLVMASFPIIFLFPPEPWALSLMLLPARIWIVIETSARAWRSVAGRG
jgi:hypothetical protein